ncbi:unnamed protein product [Caenorhabditis auriculariae]|uniref:Uncharacterized protein n=1 Tax=Caenorhabditis auriculariae TaxID=2777116 RepID=A0A8S1HIT6_9PELO|nr:unnamed protein product [Caenorhabditis auriculariae]
MSGMIDTEVVGRMNQLRREAVAAEDFRSGCPYSSRTEAGGPRDSASFWVLCLCRRLCASFHLLEVTVYRSRGADHHNA